VAKASAVVSGGASRAFQTYSADLQRAEQASHVTPAQFAALVADGDALAQALESTNLNSQAATTQQLVELQDLLDQAFIEGSYHSAQWAQVEQQLYQAIYTVNFTTTLPQQTFTEMQTVARAAHVSRAEYTTLVADEKAINAALGPNVNTTLGGAVPRDPLVIYFNGQVSQFVHKRHG
jgi:hypothetical protein